MASAARLARASMWRGAAGATALTGEDATPRGAMGDDDEARDDENKDARVACRVVYT